MDRERLRERLSELGARGVYVGTSSWKYAGWCGQIYDAARYEYRGRFAEARFKRSCLAEYAEVFKTVCVDAAYYQFPTEGILGDLMAQVPPDFRFAFKVTDEITLPRFSRLPRFGQRAGQLNPRFLDVDRFSTAFLGPCTPHQGRIGLLVFEFSRFYATEFARGREFVDRLEGFLGRLPRGWPYGVEVRNRNLLQPEYFAMLARHGVTHVYNNWTAMPSVAEQWTLPGSRTTPDRLGARFLLQPGRKYEEAVRAFSPYDRVQEACDEGRSAGAQLIRAAAASQGRTEAFLYVNNRFEGNAPQTISAMLEQAAVSDA
ncbi:MAG TPA: DUF72 domain-containing protein [Verrucomicrobiota bacterium]|nr:DUF72 domain-containing protein [Verrucomicrobiota bacterium]HNU50358.1 DUF72 domain-containing protein [Verrucomicrobiota bacterium]